MHAFNEHKRFMVFDKYEQLSEDAQRLLCFYVDMGYGSNKRMDEHIYLLGRYCFTAFDGKAALEELTQKGILQLEGKDWYANAPPPMSATSAIAIISVLRLPLSMWPPFSRCSRKWLA